MKTGALWPGLGVGVGLRPVHYPDVLADVLAEASGPDSDRPDWFEAISENYMGIETGGSGGGGSAGGGRPIRMLEQVRERYPVVLHGVSLSIGSVDPLNPEYLRRLKALVDRIEPSLVSDHLCWTGVKGENLHDLLPLPYTQEALSHIEGRVRRVQDFLGRRILLENVSSYLTYAHSEMTEWEFLSEVCRQADCGLLLDVNNVYVSSVNHGFDPMEFLRGVPRERVAQMHLAGHSEARPGATPRFLIDTHDHPVCDEVWSLYRYAVRLFGPVATLIEWDENIPPMPVLLEEASRARKIREEEAHGTPA